MTNNKTTSNETPPVVNKPYETTRYTKFYLTLLILSTIGTSLSLIGLFSNIPTAISNFDIAPVFAILSLGGVVVTLVSAVALALLWQKNIAGLWLKLGSYAASILLTIGMLPLSGPVLQRAIDKATESITNEGMSIDPGLMTTITSTTYYISVAIGLIAAITFSLLWWFAWKDQQKADS